MSNIIKIKGRKYDAEKLEASKKDIKESAPKPKKKDVTKGKGAK